MAVLDYYNNYTIEWVAGSWEVQGQIAGRSTDQGRPTFWFVDDCVLTISQHGGEQREREEAGSSCVFSQKGNKLIHKGFTLKSQLSPKGPTYNYYHTGAQAFTKEFCGNTNI